MSLLHDMWRQPTSLRQVTCRLVPYKATEEAHILPTDQRGMAVIVLHHLTASSSSSSCFSIQAISINGTKDARHCWHWQKRNAARPSSSEDVKALILLTIKLPPSRTVSDCADSGIYWHATLLASLRSKGFHMEVQQDNSGWLP